jgi:hypothetical protein
MVYISILEQQEKYGDALEILSGQLGSLLMIEVDKLRIQVFSETLCLGFFYLKSTSVDNIVIFYIFEFIHKIMHILWIFCVAIIFLHCFWDEKLNLSSK